MMMVLNMTMIALAADDDDDGLQALGLTRRLSAKRTFLNNVMHQVERYGDAHAKVMTHNAVFLALSVYSIT